MVVLASSEDVFLLKGGGGREREEKGPGSDGQGLCAHVLATR